MTEVLRCESLTKEFSAGELAVKVLQDISFSVQKGETVSIMGRSGAGKTTLLQLLGGLDLPTTGTITLGGNNLAKLNAADRGRLRNKQVGFIYQFHHLLPEFTALENVAMPLLIGGCSPAEASERAAQLLTRVGLAPRLKHKPGELSGGERQRAAVARALVTRPACVLADEPTGNLDHESAGHVQELMLELNQELGTSYIIVTHDPVLAGKMQHQLVLEDGRLI
ncbi:Lipoprotein-releasing system ATP-binding protein LolD [hydrothermal vent metagenome]|uniref:Lipoprotein-releasing system ATP-binding protein LolD n=1 Tax=hydrothermal vent metagenome TaxID=652676 RepID=A0A3B0ZAF0_9ZZZZ